MTATEHDAPGWSYRPGDWFAVFGEQVTLVLPPTQKQRVVALWSLVDDGAGFDDVLDALLVAGLSSLPGFVLVGIDGAATRLLVRGADVRAIAHRADAEVVLDGGASHTWAERTLDDVDALELDLPPADSADTADTTDTTDTATGAGFAIRTGLVRVGRIERGVAAPVPTVAPTTAADPGPAAGPQVVAEPSPLDDDGPATELMEAVPAAPDPGAAVVASMPDPLSAPIEEVEAAAAGEPLATPDAPERESEPEPAGWMPPPPSAPPILPPTSAPTTPPPASPPPGQLPGLPTSPPPSEPPAMTTPLVAAPLTPPAPLVPPPVDPPEEPPLAIGSWEPVAPGPTIAPDHDGHTVVGAAVPAGGHSAPAGAVATLLVSDGQRVVVDRPVLIGRAPEARRFGVGERPVLVSVPSRQHEISSTHVEVRPGTGADLGAAVVTDMGSTNGTVVVQPGLEPEDLKAGIALALVPGAVINLGDGVTVQVARP